MSIKPFQRQGNYTTVDNAVIDEIMPMLSGSEWKILSLIIRKTVGWHKNKDAISYVQIQEGTGIKSPSTVSKALAGLKDKSLIVIRSSDKWSANEYYLNTEYEVRTTKNVVDTTTNIVVDPTTKNVDTKESIKRNNKYIYTNGFQYEQPPEAAPFPEVYEKRQEMVAAIAAEVKTVFAIGVNSDEFEQIADGIISKGIEPEQVRGFYKNWWKVDGNGHYKGKPALKSLLQEIDNYASGSARNNKYDYIGGAL